MKEGGLAVEHGHTVRGHDEAKVHETANEDLKVPEHVDDIAQGDLAFRRIAPLVRAQACSDVGSLRLAEPLGVLGKIGYDEEENEGDDAGQGAFEDEDPPPALIAAHAAHLADGAGQETSESAGQRGRAEEKGEAALSFGPLVPHANEIEASREHARLGDTQEEPRGQETAVILHQALTDGHDAEEEHAEREPNVRPQPLQQDV